ncbi:hypothetical protein SELMODRAFT_420308 [Selaginella moellendorffii]|uniref:Pentacotripeptide-repeat region of PRORP domain-containing protein n=1 Tax=Selaginella moellendorffii TaxID=88036 RepID=D8SBK7_SELML|nr:pentatricopeptide repeat-containing protein At4g21190 [Selaginella moellendorffii]XP_024541518.1 pentatricopeptide repeat-containing protein At4g21190 [Selaginella moellendorffii]EFJ18272.1 hypothetical protein SELMODRAFT_420308 [Selaginella moellendorffii]|eukprot:XP_002980621.1 pentatricopeptide repeat-containing protein At4g21190 [Selaginella moellendorffii]
MPLLRELGYLAVDRGASPAALYSALRAEVLTRFSCPASRRDAQLDLCEAQEAPAQAYDEQGSGAGECGKLESRQNEVPNERTKAPYDVLPRRTKMQRARDLVDAVLPLPDVKGEIWAACDTWIAWELRFPLHTIEMATHRLFRLKQWRRVIHVIKWMFSKGHGFTMNTYGCLLRALDIDGRVDEVEHIWHTFVVTKQESVPRVMYARMITTYDRRALPDKAIKMFKELELSGTRPDPATIIKIGKIYEKLGFTNKTAELLEKHKPTKTFISFKFRTKSHKFMGVPGHDRRRLTSSEKQKKRKLRERLATIIDFS